MPTSTRRFSKTEIAQRGDTIFQSIVTPKLTLEDEGKFAAIDIESSEFVIDSDQMVACDKLYSRCPDAQVWTVRIGSRYLHRFGGRNVRGIP